MGDCDLRRWSSDPHEAAAGRGLELPPGARLLQLRPFNPIKHCRKTLLHTPAKIHDPASQLSTDGWKKPEHKHCCFYPENSGRLLKQQRPCQYVVSNTAAFPSYGRYLLHECLTEQSTSAISMSCLVDNNFHMHRIRTICRGCGKKKADLERVRETKQTNRTTVINLEF